MREENRKPADSKKPKYRCLIVDDEESIAQTTCEYFNMFHISSTKVNTVRTREGNIYVFSYGFVLSVDLC